MRWVLIGGLLLLGLLAGVAGAADGPLADAGLDQSVTQGATVHLDAGGSTAPDGEITSYEWRIERPNGTETTPECSSCVRTSFVADQPGTYAVTVEVTGDDGATDRDTLYVEVSAREMPEATLEGPTTLTVGEAGTFSIDGQAGDASLSSYTWSIDGEKRASKAWKSTAERSFSFEEAGKYIIVGVITDTAGYQDQAKHIVDVNPNKKDTQSSADTIGTERDSGGSGLETTYDRLFVGNDGKLYVAVGNEVTKEDEFRMYLPNGEELVIRRERISNSPGTISDDPVSMIDDSAIGFENDVAQLKFVQDIEKYTKYDISKLKQMMPKTDCQLSGHDAQRCVEQNLVGLTEEGKNEHEQSFTNTGASWTEKEFDGHPELGPDETRASTKPSTNPRERLITAPHPSHESDNANSGSTSQADYTDITKPDHLTPPDTDSHFETGAPKETTTDPSDTNNTNGSPGSGHSGIGGNSRSGQELTAI